MSHQSLGSSVSSMNLACRVIWLTLRRPDQDVKSKTKQAADTAGQKAQVCEQHPTAGDRRECPEV